LREGQAQPSRRGVECSGEVGGSKRRETARQRHFFFLKNKKRGWKVRKEEILAKPVWAIHTGKEKEIILQRELFLFETSKRKKNQSGGFPRPRRGGEKRALFPDPG